MMRLLAIVFIISGCPNVAIVCLVISLVNLL